MKSSFISKIAQTVIVLIGVSFLTFILIYISPGDAAEVMLSDDGRVPSEELLAKTRHEMGLDRPFIEQYVSWLKGAFTGDLGMSYSSKTPVVETLSAGLWPTLSLAIMALFIMLIISFPLGIISAVKKGKWQDKLILGLTFLGVSIPSFWLGLMFLSFFGVTLNWVSVSGGNYDFQSIILPALTLAIAMASKYTRQIRSIFIEELEKDYVLGARMRGIPERKILWRHILPNASLPLITLLGLSLGSLLGGTAVVEIVYNWPGMGTMAVNAISARDFPLVQGYVLWMAIFYLLINFVVDFSYMYFNPKLRKQA